MTGDQIGALLLGVFGLGVILYAWYKSGRV